MMRQRHKEAHEVARQTHRGHKETQIDNSLLALKCIHFVDIQRRHLQQANCLVNQDCSVNVCDTKIGESKKVKTDKEDNIDKVIRSPNEAAIGVATLSGLTRIFRDNTITPTMTKPNKKLAMEAVTTDEAQSSMA